MSPQPTTPAAPAAAAETPKVKLPEVNGEHPKGSPRWLVALAITLEKQRAEVMETIDENRKSLRSLLKQNALEDDLAKFVRDFYPEKEKGASRSIDELDSTRKLREAVRKS